VTTSLYTTMTSAMRTRTAFPSDWRRVDGDKLHRILAELERTRVELDRTTACR
jgi:hypothetical protein